MATMMSVAASAAGAGAEAAPVAIAEAVERRYAGGRRVGPIDLRVRPGEVLALMGPNGAGKSTLLRLLATADRADHGRLAWWGSDDPRRARRWIGYAADEPAEEATLSARQATHFWCSQWVRDRRRVAVLTADALSAFGLGERSDEPVGTLSYGLRRRLALAQALVHQPVLALLDEPSAGLDPGGAVVVTRILRERAASGFTTVVASNDPELVAAVADRVALLQEGRCFRVAPLAQLLAEVPRRRIVDLRVGGAPPGVGGGAVPATEAGASVPRGALTRSLARRVALVPGVASVSVSDGGLSVELEEGASLARLVAAAETGEPGIRGLEVRHPDLRDCFRALTSTAHDGGPR